MSEADSIYISVIIPAYNEKANIGPTVKEVLNYLSAKDYSYELIVVDDGSRDGTKDVVNKLAQENKNLKLVSYLPNRGKGYAVKRGMLGASGKWRLFMDADNSTKICEVDNFLKALETGFDIAIGSRRIEGAKLTVPQPLHRRLLGWAYRLFCATLLGTKASDYNCGFKLFYKDAAQRIFSKIRMERWSFDTEIIFFAKKLGYKIKEVPVSWEFTGTSAVRPIRDGIRSYMDLLRIRENERDGLYS